MAKADYWDFVQIYEQTNDPIFSAYSIGLEQLKKKKLFEELDNIERMQLTYRSLEYIARYRALKEDKDYLLNPFPKNDLDKVINFLFHQMEQGRLDNNCQWKVQTAVNAAITLLNHFNKQGNSNIDKITFELPVKKVKEAKK